MTDTETKEMRIDPARARTLVSQLRGVNDKIAAVAQGGNVSEEMELFFSPRRILISRCILRLTREKQVRLVAVSKLKPANDILALHQPPSAHLHFGENYQQELVQKAELLPRSIKWHFIGGLQSGTDLHISATLLLMGWDLAISSRRGKKKINLKLSLIREKGHCKPLGKIPNLWCVSSIDTFKKAQLLNKSRGDYLAANPNSDVPEPKINVHVQVNTSGESSKSGCEPGSEVVSLCRAVESECPNLHLLGLMTIGAIARSKATTPENENEDFVTLKEQRDLVQKELKLDRELELSMGMSEDFEGAIAMGSGEVRIGSTIFGERPAKADAKITM
jgi:pyridoxal phosphate enzyme (YggS family)